MRNAHGRVRRVDALAAVPGGAIDIDADVLWPDLNFDFFGLRQDNHFGGRGMNASLRLGGGDALHPVRSALIFHAGVRAPTADLEDDLFIAADAALVLIHHLDGPALGV